MKLKKLLLLGLTVLSLTVAVGCNQPSSSEPSQSEQPSSQQPTVEVEIETETEDGTPINSVEGTKTETAHVVDFYYNQPNKGVYKRVYVEDGEQITIFKCLVSGLSFVGFFYDEFGVEEFDFKTEIKSDLKLYAYHLGNGQAPDVYEYAESGEFKVNWGRVKGASYEAANGEMLPLSANKGQEIKFRVVPENGSNKIFKVLVNNKEVTADTDGIYSITVSGTTRIVTSIVGNEERTYTVEANPDWLQNDGCVIFGWIWGPDVAGEWIEADLEGNTFSFTTNKELSGFLFVRCVRGTINPNWNIMDDSVGRIYNKTIDFICVPGRTTYNGANAWVQYPQQ